jgi:tetratricopeptide (TPR) repeat protein/transcriptional regulator with XRE-family HTH domain
VPDQPFAAALDRLRVERGLSLRDLAKVAGVPRSTLSDALSGRRLPRLQTVLAVVRACDGDGELWRQRWAGAASSRKPADPSTAPRSQASAGPQASAASQEVPRPAELPRDIAGFTGRDDELDRLSKAKLWVVHGPAGVGKTSLVVHWAHRVASGYPDGQLFLNLRGHHGQLPPMPAGAALPTLLRSLGAQRIPTELGEQERLLRSLLAGKRMLIVLDDAVSADQVRPMLPGESACAVVVTSRHHLIELTALDGADRLSLGVLAPASSAAVIAQIAGAPRVNAYPDATAVVADSCGHLPLALRLAAATLVLDPTLGMDELARRLTAPDRRAALADDGYHLDAVFAASYQGLAADEQLVFRRLSLHPGPEPDAAATAVLTGLPIGQARIALTTLAETHLIEAAGRDRYRMHDLLREFAGRTLADTEHSARTAKFRDALFDWYVEQARSVAESLAPGSARLYLKPVQARPRPDAAQWLEHQQRNVIAAIAADSAGPHAWALIDLLGVVLLRRHDVADLLVATDAGIAVADRQRNRLAAAAVRTVRAWLHWRQGDAGAARADFELALQGFREEQHEPGQAAVLLGLVAPCAANGELELAGRYAEQALACYRSLEEEHGQATTLNALANLAHLTGDLTSAARHFQASAGLLRQLGDRGSLAIALGNLTWVHAELGQQREAIECSEEALTLARAVADRYAETLSLINGAVAREQDGQLEPGLRWAGDALTLARELGDLSFQASALDVLATLERRLGADPAQVDMKRRQALELARRCQNRSTEAHLLVSAARDACRQSEGTPPDWPTAAERAEQALTLARECGARTTEGEALSLLAACALNDPNVHRETAEAAAAAVRLQATTGARLSEARARTVLAAAFDRLGQPDAAEQEWQLAREILVELDAPEAASLAKDGAMLF